MGSTTAILRARDHGVREIARQLRFSPSTISRELRRNAATRGGYLDYRATTASGTSIGAPGFRRPRTMRCGVCAGSAPNTSLFALNVLASWVGVSDHGSHPGDRWRSPMGEPLIDSESGNRRVLGRGAEMVLPRTDPQNLIWVIPAKGGADVVWRVACRGPC